MSETPGETSDADTMAHWLGALLHERHHWLQCISTTSGIALTVLLELRSSSIPSMLDAKALVPDDIPLLRFAPARYERGSDAALTRGKQGAAELWETVEILRRLVTGARKGDVECLLQAGKYPSFKTTSEMIKPMLIEALREKEAGANLAKLWAHWHDLDQKRKQENDRVMRNLAHRGWSVGARHFLECGARVNEALLIASRLSRGAPVNVDPLFEGVYGVANEMFYRELGEPTLSKEVALAWACDTALQGTLPPVAPFLAYAGTPPAFFFLAIVDALRDFEFPASEPDVTEPESVRRYIQELERHLAERKPEVSQQLTMNLTLSAKLLDHLDQEAAARNMFDSEDGGLPALIDGTSRLTYFLACSAAALRLRRQSPEFFSLPVCFYLNDRSKFHELFDPLAPPLVRYTGKGVFPTRKIKGWPEFFSAFAVQHELLLWLAVGPPDGFKAAITPYLETPAGPDWSRFVLRIATESIFEDSPIAEHVLSAFP